MPCVKARMHLVPAVPADDLFAMDSRPTHILDTIKVPKHLGQRRLTLDLPVRVTTQAWRARWGWIGLGIGFEGLSRGLWVEEHNGI